MSNGAYLKKRAIFDLLFTFFSHHGKDGKDTEIPSAHIPYTNILLMHLIDFFGLTKFAKNMHGFSLVWLLVLIVFVPFWSNQLITKWWAKFRLECLLLIFIYTNAKSIVICKPRTLKDSRWRFCSINTDDVTSYALNNFRPKIKKKAKSSVGW